MTPFDRYLTGWRGLVTGFAFWSFVGLMNFLYRWLDLFVREEVEPFYEKFIEEMTGSWGTGLMFLILIYTVRAVTMRRLPWHRAVVVHLAVVPAYSVLHTLWNWGTRVGAYAVLDLGRYDYGIMRYRFLMEFPNDALDYAILASLVHLYLYYRESRDREVRVAQLESELKGAQLHALASQLRPHFLFNALNTVSSVMYRSVEDANRVLQRLGDLLRRSLKGADAQHVALREELDTLELYLDIMKARFGDRLEIVVDTDPAILDAPVPAFVLQPLIENALEHGDPGSGVVAEVRVTVREAGDRLIVTVRDNGPGPTTTGTGNGIGLRNTRERLERLYGPGPHLHLASHGAGGCVVTLELPLSMESSAP